MAQRTIHRLAQTVPIVALDGKFGSFDIILFGPEDERNLIERSCRSEVIHQAEVKLYIIVTFIGTTIAVTIVQDDLAITIDKYEMSMATRNDGCGSMLASTAHHLYI